MITESNMEQILELQRECYQNRIGAIYGDYKVIEVWYDWDAQRQMWKLECTKCGKTKVTHNGKDYAKGKNKGNCSCEREKARSLKISEKTKREDDAPNNPKWIGSIMGDWKIIQYTPHKGWLVECQKCGRQTYHKVAHIKCDNPIKCTCENISEYRDPKWIGQRFGHLVVQKYVGYGNLECKCDCGNIVDIKGSFLTNNQQVTCGRDCKHHLDNVITHHLSNDRLYRIWKGMLHRCYNPKSFAYKIYGGRGIDVCEEWRDDLFAFREWALSHGYADDLSIDRIDSDKGYSPDNCRWATAKEQNSHLHPRWTFTAKRKCIRKKVKTWVIDGVEKSVEQWCEEYGMSRNAVLYRVNTKGMSPYEALTTPLSPQGRGRKSQEVE